MCGIAGYNVSTEFAKAHLTDKNQFALLREAWLHNQHRGSDAAGYFRVDAETGKPFVRKAGMPADEILDASVEKGSDEISVSTVFAAHTRAATLGDPSDPRNNHPVEFQNLLVTHNGSINNHKKFMNLVPKNLKDQIGEVDSTAIAIALDKVESPLEVGEVVGQLRELDGGMAIHAAWKQHPGVSVLARGKRSPLIVRFNEKLGAVFYASVDEANFAMIAAVGLNPNDKGWEIRKFDEHAMGVVQDGRFVGWAAWKPKGWQPGRNLLPFTVTRLHGKKKVWSSDKQDTPGAIEEVRSLADLKASNKGSLVYTQAKGFEKKSKHSFPFSSSNWAISRVLEADEVWEHDTKPYLFAVFGDVEVIVHKTGNEIMDVYNHATHKGKRWEYKEKPSARKDDEPLTFNKWLIMATTRENKPVKDAQKYGYKKGVQYTRPGGGRTALPNPTRGGVRTSSDGSPETNGAGSKGGRKSTRNTDDAAIIHRLMDDDDYESLLEPVVVDIGIDLTWEDHSRWETHPMEPFGFLDDLSCPDHDGTPYSAHKDPYDCERLKMASLAFFSSIRELTIWYDIDPAIEFKSRHVKDPDGNEVGYCSKGEAGGEGFHCEWVPYQWRQVFLGYGENNERQVLEVMTGEQCLNCNSKMWVATLPDWVEEWTRDKVYV